MGLTVAFLCFFFECPAGKMAEKSRYNILFYLFLFCYFCSAGEVSTSRLMVNSSEKALGKSLPAYLQSTEEGWKVNATLVALIR